MYWKPFGRVGGKVSLRLPQGAAVASIHRAAEKGEVLGNPYSSTMCAYELDRRLEAEGFSTPGDPIDLNVFDPGLMPGTGLARDWGPLGRFVSNGLLPPLVPIVRRLGVSANTAEASGRALAHLTTDPSLEGVSGRYFELGKEARSSEESYDRNKAEELWETSDALIGLRPGGNPGARHSRSFPSLAAVGFAPAGVGRVATPIFQTVSSLGSSVNRGHSPPNV